MGSFFKELGAEVVLSSETTKEIMLKGINAYRSDACLPLKVFHGHVVDLVEKGVDYVFIPRLKSIAKGEYICPKFCGLPDMVRYSVENISPVIDTEIDIRKSNKQLTKAFFETGLYFTKDKAKIKLAANKAMFNHKFFRYRMEKGYMPSDLLNGKFQRNTIRQGALTVAVLGHYYNLYDSYVNSNLFDKLAKSGINIITPQMTNSEVTDEYLDKLTK